MTQDGENLTKHTSFIKNAVKDIFMNNGASSQFLAAQLIANCSRDGLTEESLINSKDMCPYCFNQWNYGQYQMKSSPKVRRKGKYKVTALELKCLNCKKIVKVNNSKVRRSQIKRIFHPSSKEILNKRKPVNSTDLVKTNNDQVPSLKTKKKKNKDSLSILKETPTFNKQVSSSSHNKYQSISNGKSFSNPKNVSQVKNNIALQKNREQKKRMKLQKHLTKSNLPTVKPKSVLENFLNSVNNI